MSRASVYKTNEPTALMSMLILGFILLFIAFAATAHAQQKTAATPQPNSSATVPNLVRFSGHAMDESGKAMTGTVGITFSLYEQETGGTPLWLETQNAQLDSKGYYTVLLGATNPDGLPADMFVSTQARWVGAQISGQAERARVMLLAVPYAMKAGDAATIGGLPPSAFLLAPPPVSAVSQPSVTPQSAATSAAAPPPATNVTTTGGTVNAIPLFTTANNIQNSILSQTATTTVSVAGKLNFPATGVATAAAGKVSRPETFVASAFNSASSTAVAQTFQFQSEPGGNNTASPFGTLNLLYGSGTTAPTETGLKISNKGLVTFAAGQTFPGTGKGTITGVAVGAGLTGGGTTGAVTVGLDTTKVPELGTNNTFSGTQKFNGNTGIGVAPSGTGYTPLSVGTANSFGTWFSIANTSAGGHTWNIISAGGGNAEGAGNLGITDLTGKSTIWLEGNTNTTTLTATATSGSAIIDADVFGTNNGAFTPGLRFGGASSGEGITSNRVGGINAFGLQLFTEFVPRLSIVQDGRVGIGTTHPVHQLEVDSSSNGYAAIFAQGGAAPNGSGQNGSDGIDAFGNNGDLSSGSTIGGNGISAFGAGASFEPGAGGVFTGGPSTGDGIEVFAGGPTSGFGPYAAFLDGDILVNGGVYNESNAIKLDHPLDPANKYLLHSSVASSEMKNMYDGTITTDASGEAIVELPEWFESFNRDFRYQLTVIGQFAQAIVAGKIADHHFTIRTDKPNVEVSWQVTGVRQDAWANAHPLTVEAPKNDRERGHYMHPELYNASEEAGVDWAHNPATMKKIKERRQAATR